MKEWKKYSMQMVTKRAEVTVLILNWLSQKLSREKEHGIRFLKSQ